MDIRKRLYKRIKRFVKAVLAAIGRFMGRQSLVPDQPIMDVNDFRWAATLEANYAIIRSELDKVLGYRESLPKLHELQKDQYRISADDKWKTFVLFGWGFQADEGKRLCPETTRLVEQIPGLRSAFFSILAPGAEIPEHRALVRGLLRGQLALVVPEDRENCYISVEGTRHHWQEGRMFIFDDTYLHEVHNNTPQERVVLILHFDRPMRWPGKLLHLTLVAIIRRTSFVSKARRNYARWAERFRNEARA